LKPRLAADGPQAAGCGLTTSRRTGTGAARRVISFQLWLCCNSGAPASQPFLRRSWKSRVRRFWRARGGSAKAGLCSRVPPKRPFVSASCGAGAALALGRNGLYGLGPVPLGRTGLHQADVGKDFAALHSWLPLPRPHGLRSARFAGAAGFSISRKSLEARSAGSDFHGEHISESC
jgi:hypothetical protein